MQIDQEQYNRGRPTAARDGRGGAFFGGGRPGPQRFNSGGAANRPHPYATMRPTPAPAANWQHDLFGESSDLYNPTININNVAARLGQDPPPQSQASSSLRPFGSATPAPVSVLQPPTAPASLSLHSRFGIKGASNDAAETVRAEQARREAEERLALVEQRKDEIKAWKEQKKVYDKDSERAKNEADGFVVQVEGLVWGTSAEDVQTAFGQYGETSFCFILNGETAGEDDDLIARLTFERKKDAESACSKLNGAIADGKPLKVQIVPAIPFPAALPPEPTPLASAVPTAPRGGKAPAASSSRAGPPANAPSGPRRGGLPSRPRAQAQPVAPAPRTMYADSIEAADPRLNGGSMDVDMAAPSTAAPPRIPTGPSAGRNRAAPPPNKPAATPSLLSRVGIPQASLPTGPAAQKNGNTFGRPAAANGSLLSRLG